MGWWKRKQPQEDVQADAETLWARQRVAATVRRHLAVAGLPVLPDGMYPGGGPGAVVWVDPGKEAAGTGVWIGWGVAPVLNAYRGQDLAGTEEGAAAETFARAVVEAMSGAMRDVLAAVGFGVTVTLAADLSFTVCVETAA
ncbi:hypothetical protein ABT300_26335 [Streptomyces sp. NPDC001027]|uniref:hypothetical protein n=1 Tax=Streptomyces sp. NPDC001027 TaxID=3154771 RepID=UPI0033334342